MRTRMMTCPTMSLTTRLFHSCKMISLRRFYNLIHICIVWTTVYHSTEVVQSRDRCLEPTTIRIHTIQCRHVCTHCADLLSDLFARLALQLSVRPATSMVKP